MSRAKEISNLSELDGFNEVNLTGGEPMLDIDRTIEIARYFKERGCTVYCYSALFHNRLRELLPFIDGLHFTLHKESGLKEMNEFSWLQNIIYNYPEKSFRLYMVQGFSEIITLVPGVWSRIELKPWIEEGECPLPEGEELFILKEK